VHLNEKQQVSDQMYLEHNQNRPNGTVADKLLNVLIRGRART